MKHEAKFIGDRKFLPVIARDKEVVVGDVTIISLSYISSARRRVGLRAITASGEDVLLESGRWSGPKNATTGGLWRIVQRIEDKSLFACDNPEEELGKEVKGGRESNRALNNLLGTTPLKFIKVFNACQREAWLSSLDSRLINDFAFNWRGIYPKRVYRLHKKQGMLLQAYEDGVRNITPLMFETGYSPKELKDRLGKGLWKSLCKNSFSRNKLIATFPLGIDKRQIQYTQTLPSSLIPHAHKLNVRLSTRQNLVVEWLINNRLLTKTEHRHIDEISDTLRMYAQAFPDHKSKDIRRFLSGISRFDQLEVQHRALTAKIMEMRDVEYKSEFEWYKSCPVKHFRREPGSIEYTLLKSKEEICKEGQEMSHCVYSYANACAEGSKMIFRVEGPEERATLELYRAREGWAIGQFYRRFNGGNGYGAVSGEARRGAQGLLAALTEGKEDTKEAVKEEAAA